MKVMVTGSSGFIGKHLMEALGRREGVTALGFDIGDAPEQLEQGLAEADFIFHLAGVNRPQSDSEFQTGNAGLTADICSRLAALGRRPVVILSSSVQAALDNPYGISKRHAEEALAQWTASTGSRTIIFRLKNVFGKWCRPNYNSVTATFCYNIAHDLPITVSDPAKELELVYIDDVVAAFLNVLDEKAQGPRPKADCGNHKSEINDQRLDLCLPTSDLGHPSSVLCCYREVPRTFKTTLGELAGKIRSFRESRRSVLMPDFNDAFTRCLYATYLSYLEGPDFAYALDQKRDPRGSLAEFIKQPHFGQIFVSRTKPGVKRGNHYHHTKTEKFMVVEGDAIIRFCSIIPEVRNQKSEVSKSSTDLRFPTFDLPLQIIEHRVSGKDFRVVDIPPGYTHSIENVGDTELITLFWASEIFDPGRPDTYVMEVES